MSKSAEFDLYFDESGGFMETSTDPAERERAGREGIGRSQLVGLLVPRAELTFRNASHLLSAARTGAGVTVTHATEISDPQAYNRMTRLLLLAIQENGWQPVRLVNEERVQYGNRRTTYVNMVAELVIRICRLKRLEGLPKVSIRLFPALVVVDDKQGFDLEKDEYLDKLTEYLAIVAIRKGLAAESRDWRVEEIDIMSARERPELQLCDHLSNATYENFRRSDPGAKASLISAFGPYSQSLYLRDELERAALYIQEDSIGLAIRALGERLVQKDGGGLVREAAVVKLAESVDLLSKIGKRPRDAQLLVLVTWMEQLVELRRSLDAGLAVGRWLHDNVARPLLQALGQQGEGEVAWFLHSVASYRLMACNHLGDLVAAREQATVIGSLRPLLAGQGEYMPLLAQGMIHNAVHLTDCFEHAAAAASMAKVADAFGVMTDLLGSELLGDEEQRHSDIRAAALGTQLQAELYAGLRNPARLEAARKLSEQAIDEFSSAGDRMRQWQYRAHIETAAGCYAEARRFLALGIGADGDSHAAIAERISALGREAPEPMGFPLLHWLRLGAGIVTCEKGSGEVTEFRAALDKSALLKSWWVTGEARNYPAHGILRHAAVLQAVFGELDAARSSWRHLEHILQGQRKDVIVLRLIQIATAAELAVASIANNPDFAQKLLRDSPGNSLTLPSLCRAVRELAEQHFPAITRLIEALLGTAEKLAEARRDDKPAISALLGVARQIGY